MVTHKHKQTNTSPPAHSVQAPQTDGFRLNTANPLQPARSGLHRGIRETVPVPEGRPAASHGGSRTLGLTCFLTKGRPAPCNGGSRT